MSGVFKVLERFNLEEISDDWIKAKNFDSSGLNIPLDYQNFLDNLDLPSLFDEANHTVKPLVRSKEIYSLSWDQLVDQKARPKALVCFLNHVISKAVVSKFPEKPHVTGLKAAEFYFLMISIPNSNVFCVFSSELYSNCLQLINSVSSAKPPDDRQLSVSCLSRLVDALSLALKPGNLCLSDDSIDATVFTLSELTRSKECTFQKNSFHLMKQLCIENERNIGSVVCCILQRLFPNFLLGICQKTDLSNKEVSALQNQTICFISDLIPTVTKDSFEPFTILLKKMCTISSDKTEFRQKICDIVVKLLRSYPPDSISEFLVFVLKFTYDESVSNRVFGIELIGCLLLENIFERQPQDISALSLKSEDEVMPPEISMFYLLYALFSRVSDVAGSVRTRALSVLANSLKFQNQNLQKCINAIFVLPFVTEDQCEDALHVFMDFRDFLKKLKTSASQIPLEHLLGGKAVVEKIVDRCLDSKVFVRRFALQVLSRIVSLGRHWIKEEILSVLGCHCRDTASSIRSSSAVFLTELIMEYPDDLLVLDTWVQNVFPLVEDNENRVSGKAVECMEEVILKNLVALKGMSRPAHELPWKIMNALGRLQVRKFFSKACQVWGEKSVLSNYRLLTIFTSHIGSENNIATWSMMASMSDYLSITNAEHFLEYFYNNIYKNPEADHRLSQLVIEVLAVSCNALSEDKQQKLQSELESEMLSFALPVTILPKCVEIMQTLSLIFASERDGANDDGQNCVSPPWAVRIAQVSEKFIDSSLHSPEPVIANEELFVRAVIALGEAALLAPNTVKSDTIKQLGRVIDPASDHVPESSAKVKAGIVVTLGKMSLQCERLAKSMVAVLGRLLSSTDNSDIKSNVMIALADLTIRYTALVEDLLPEMCLCLKDKVRLVRENTLVLITRLIQEDYLKMKSSLLFHLLSALTDEDETIRAMTCSFFIDSALLKHKHLFQNHLLECLFYFNGYLNHEHCQISVTDRERKAFSLQGQRHKQHRETIYRFMLSQMDIQQRFKSQRCIVDSICGAAVEETLQLDSFGEDVLRDALFCLLAEESRIVPSAGDNDEDVQADVDDAAHQALHIAKTKFISEVVRGYVIGSEVPIIVNLLQKLCDLNSPLTKDVIKFLHFQVQEYEADIGEIFKNDPDLAKKVLADLRRYETENRMFVSDSEEDSSSTVSSSPRPEDADVRSSRLYQATRQDPSRSSKSRSSKSTPQKSPRKSNAKTPDQRCNDSSMFSDASVPSNRSSVAKNKTSDRQRHDSSMFSDASVSSNRSPGSKSKTSDRRHHDSSMFPDDSVSSNRPSDARSKTADQRHRDSSMFSDVSVSSNQSPGSKSKTSDRRHHDSSMFSDASVSSNRSSDAKSKTSDRRHHDSSMFSDASLSSRRSLDAGSSKTTSDRRRTDSSMFSDASGSSSRRFLSSEDLRAKQLSSSKGKACRKSSLGRRGLFDLNSPSK